MIKPRVLIPCDVKTIGMHPFHAVGEKYLNAVAHGADAWPLLLPAWGDGTDLRSLTEHYDLDALLDNVEGVFLPGSVSNVHPQRYRGSTPDFTCDAQRDAAVFPLIETALTRQKPLFAVCRGLQELNVALGGTLHARVQDVPGMLDHRENDQLPREQQYDLAHDVDITEGGLLADVLATRRIQVNSLHTQGINRLAPGLTIEARAADGLVEAVSLPQSWALAVQWHPEWRFDSDPHSERLFKAFGEALRA